MSDPTFHHPSPLHIGELQLETPLGRGGMGEVWQARHISRNLRAAVKVVHTDTPRLKASILDEIRAIASLSHPNIITLYDWGEVRAADAQASEGRLIAGSPYLVMELLAGGDLVSRRAGLRWDDLKAVLLSLLSALGHAHARGIIHCDVKPSNILLDDLALSALRLSDFGIASRRTADPQQLRGSPGFIAPERLKSHQAPVQPQTDLYSVGCLAHLLATGSPPFLGDDAAHLAYQHFYVPPPVLPPHPGVPDGFAAWVLRLLQKSPVDRFPSTAAAATMLQQLGAPEDPTRIVHVVLPDPPSSATMTAPLPDGVSGQMAGTMSSTPPLCPVPGVRIPSQWRRVAAFAERRALPWVGAGLRLFTLRNVPLVGREIERDQLWRVLCTAINERATRVVLLEGEPGVGCSRLASWLALRAAEEGVVHHTLHFERGGDGWSQLVRQLMGLKPQPRQSLMHVTVWLKARGVHGPEDAALLAELIDAHATEPPTGAQRALLRRILQIACADQPTVLQLEDVHQTPGVCRWVSSILEKHDDLPVLFILTVKPGTHQDEIRALGAQKEVFHLPVPPLRQRAHQRLLQEFLWLDGDLVPRLEALTRGEPGFAIGLVAEWIAQGWLIPSPNGLKLGPDASDVLPRSMAQVWTQRLDRIFAERGADHAIAMERAALLGDVVTASQWEAACADLNVEHEALWRALSDNQLVVARGAAW
ncbi:MAG: protein kinase, partial [Myxococcota bacterium]